MYPRPRSRKKPIEIVAVETLAEAVAEVRATGVEPPAIVSGRREWSALKRQPEAEDFVRGWPGDCETFMGVPVCISRLAEGPRVMASFADMEAALLPD